MKVVLLLLCLVLIQVFSANAEDKNADLSRDASVGMGRQVREAGQQNQKEKKGKKNAKVNRKKKSKPRRIKKSKKAIGRKKKSNSRGKKTSKKANGRKKKSNPSGKKKSKKSNGRKKKSNSKGKKKSKKTNGRENKSKPRGKTMPKKANGRKTKSNPKGKKNSKKANGRENNKGRSKGKKGSKKKKSGGKSTKTARQNDCCERAQKFNNYRNRIKQANNILKLVNTLNNKKEKAMTVFNDAASLIARATSDGTECAGGPIPPEATVVYTTLQTCSTTASDLCDSSKITGLDISRVESCKTKLENYIAEYKDCIENCGEFCSCITGLALVDIDCTPLKSMQTETLKAKKECLGKTVEGSFVYCRQQERLVAKYVEKCKDCPVMETPVMMTPVMMTTKAPSVTGRKQRQFQRRAGMVKKQTF